MALACPGKRGGRFRTQAHSWTPALTSLSSSRAIEKKRFLNPEDAVNEVNAGTQLGFSSESEPDILAKIFHERPHGSEITEACSLCQLVAHDDILEF